QPWTNWSQFYTANYTTNTRPVAYKPELGNRWTILSITQPANLINKFISVSFDGILQMYSSTGVVIGMAKLSFKLNIVRDGRGSLSSFITNQSLKNLTGVVALPHELTFKAFWDESTSLVTSVIGGGAV